MKARAVSGTPSVLVPKDVSSPEGQEEVKTSLNAGQRPTNKRYTFRSNNSKIRSYKEKKPQYKKLRCHFCRSQDADKDYVVCGNYPDCRCGFCHDCLRDVFSYDTDQIEKGWTCPVCHSECDCTRCKNRFRVVIPANPKALVRKGKAHANSMLGPNNGRSNMEKGKGKGEKLNEKNRGREMGGVKRAREKVMTAQANKEPIPANHESGTVPLSSLYPYPYALPKVQPAAVSYYPQMVSRPGSVAPYIMMGPGSQLYPSYFSPDYCTILRNPISGQRELGYAVQVAEADKGARTKGTEAAKKSQSPRIQETRSENGAQEK
eukprot:TRINITY_DN2379_c0_g2_i7.p1 TRINITY_DN2379_c0_g2~~TRINITY_DN2379_c0_g2_i7.p1  ORF type:complete len:319 (+),score=26.84 TRINITY_DN2379_c0_g2_i7:805-1761(+)